MTQPLASHPLLWTLIAIQIAMGAFDTLVHHEWTERLAWRSSQGRELRLHALRNALYALLFLALGWSEPHGMLAVAALLVLAVEVVVTLMDFVEEDSTRRLPASERINHTLLALNYGAILVLLAPVLVGWAQRPSAVVPVSYGGWSLMMTAAAVAVAIFGIRDLLAAARCKRLVPPRAADLAAALPARRRILVTGATGFIGSRLVEALTAAGHDVVALVRMPARAGLPAPVRIVTALAQIHSSERIDAIVNLAGEPIADGRWTATKQRRIVESRVRLTEDLVALMARLDHRPTVFVSGSAIGWYGLRGDEILDERSCGSACFSREVCRAWEAAAVAAEPLGVRTVRLRIGLVLGPEGGPLARMLTPFEFGLGGPFGTGRQWMSWIERDDLVRLVVHAIVTPKLDGAVNATAPEPVRNIDFAQALGHALRRPAVARVPTAVLRAVGGRLAEELLLAGQRVLPAKVLGSGFVFCHRTLPQAFAAILGTRPATARCSRSRLVGKWLT